MKKTTIVLSMALFTASGTLYAGSDSFFAKGKVISAEPIYETVRVNRPEEQCWSEKVYHSGRGSRSYTPTIAGAIVGGVVGNQFGKGHGRDAMTVAGALLGASVGRDIGRRSGPGYYTQEQRCETVDRFEEHDELVGYRVSYRYDGEVFWTRMERDPGKFIRIRVSVAPVGGGDYNFPAYD